MSNFTYDIDDSIYKERNKAEYEREHSEIDKILESYGFNLNFISFTKKKNDKKKIIDEIEVNSSFNIIKEKIISIIKPFLFDS